MGLAPYQITGSEWLAERERAMLADEMGLGKTIQAIAACDLVFAERVLVVCPASVIASWNDEIRKWRVGDWKALVVSYEGMAKTYRDAILSSEWSVAIFDEAHYLKSPGALRTRMAYGAMAETVEPFDAVIHHARHVWALTGTPQMNYPNELFTHFRALAPDRIVGPRSGRVWSYEQFQAHFCQTRQAFSGIKVVGSRNEAELRGKLDGFMLRRLKKDVLPDLPEVRFSEFPVEADVTDINLGIDADTLAGITNALERHGVDGLRKLSSHFAAVRRLTGVAKVKAVTTHIREFLEASKDRKIVVFAQHREVLAALRKAKGFEGFVEINGDTPIKARGWAVKHFQETPNVRGIFCQIQAAGTGITLTAASDLLFVETSWVPSENAQAAMRIHRIGQKNLCNVRYAVLPKSIDAIVARAVMRKSESIAKVLGEQV